MALGDFDSRWKNPQGADAQLMYLWAQDLIRELRKGDYISNSITDGIANSELADMAAWTIKMRNSATAGDPQDVTINGLTEETSIDRAADFVPFWDTGGGVMRKAKPSNITPAPGLVLLNSGTVTSQATLPIVLTSYTAYRGVRILLSGFLPATDATELYMRFSTDGGANYLSSGYNCSILTIFDNAATSTAGSGSGLAQILMNTTSASNHQSSTSSHGANYTIDLLNQTSTAFFPRATFDGSYFSDNDFAARAVGQGMNEAAQDCNAVRSCIRRGISRQATGHSTATHEADSGPP